MSNKEWIVNKLKNGISASLLRNKEMYESFKQETGSTSSYRSYTKKIAQYKKQLDRQQKEELSQANNILGKSDKDEEKEELLKTYVDVDADYLIELLEKKLISKGSVLIYSDLIEVAKDNDFPVRLFYIKIPNIEKVLNDLYKMNLFHVENNKKILSLQKELKINKKELSYYKENEYLNEKVLDALESLAIGYTPFDFTFNYVKNEYSYEAVALLSDWHFDEKVDLKEMHYVNEYTVSIAKKRIDKVFERIIDNCNYLKVPVVNLLFLGDMISGNLHDLAENNELGTIKAIIQLADYTSQHIRNLSRYFKTIKAIGVSGNHSRLKVKPYFKHKQVLNFEYILYEFIKRETKDIVDFIIPESFFIVHKINGVNFLTTHGDMIRGGNGLNSVPGNLSRDISLLSGTLSQADIYFDYVNIGHFHSANETKAFNGAEIIMNGSLIGANEFSLGALKKGESPSQTFYLVEKDTGIRFLDRMKIK